MTRLSFDSIHGRTAVLVQPRLPEVAAGERPDREDGLEHRARGARRHVLQEPESLRLRALRVEPVHQTDATWHFGFSNIVTTCMSPLLCDMDRNLNDGLARLLTDLPRRLDEVFNAVNAGAAGAVRHVFVTEYPDPTTGPRPPGVWWLPEVRRCGNLHWTAPLPGFQGFDGIDEWEASVE